MLTNGIIQINTLLRKTALGGTCWLPSVNPKTLATCLSNFGKLLSAIFLIRQKLAKV